MKIGDTFIVFGIPTVFPGRNAADTEGNLPVMIEAVAGQAPRKIQLLAGVVAKHQKIPMNRLCIFHVEYTGEVESTINPDKKVKGFNFKYAGSVLKSDAALIHRIPLNILLEPEEY